MRCRSLFATIALTACAPTSGRPDPALEASYRRYVEAIEAARGTIARSIGMRSEADRAEGESFLHGIVNLSVSAALIMTPEQPVMPLLPHPDARVGYNNPDNLYYITRVSDQHTYTISGKRGSAKTFLIQAMQGLPGLTTSTGATTAFLAGHDLHPGADGSFRITLAAKAPDRGDWLPLKPGTDNLLVRFSFLDWKTEQPGSISIARSDGIASSSFEMTPALAAAMLDDAATSIREQAEFYSAQAAQIAAIGANKLVGPSSAQSGAQGTHTKQWRLIGNFDLASDEALVVTVKDAPQSEYSNFMAANPWLDTFEFVHHQPSLNRTQVRADADGYIRYVVSPSDPGVPNWIDTTGRTHGILFARWQEVPGELGPEYAPREVVVKLGDVRSALPGDTPVVSPAERTAWLAERERLLRARFRDADPALPEVVRRLRALERMLGRELDVQTIDEKILD
jgi:hypothetical protein